MENHTLSSIGVISKKENLASVEHETNTNALVMESLYPFPGYNGTTVPDRTDPKSLFLVTKYIYGEDKIIRSIKNIKKSFPHFFDGAPGLINLFNKPAGAIRLKYLHYQQVGELVEAFREQGISFVKTRHVNSYSSIIKITKYFMLELVNEGIYHDRNWKELYYLSLPVQLRWNSFEKITTSIKHNVEDNNFDAALTTMYDKEGVCDFVRIYDEDSCQGKLLFIKEKYLEAIKYL
ncbi:MAG: hypothetical protein KJ578_14380 [Bacteroidetes bacterium]|nr:hypothetical protein [Bacteroidota bacterium]MBU1579700.1 hypothetical protein [Bacteroidota bacterium]MBU2558961.1 hypothetical protein [Bacteroidota bacterium]